MCASHVDLFKVGEAAGAWVGLGISVTKLGTNVTDAARQKAQKEAANTYAERCSAAVNPEMRSLELSLAT